MLANDDFETLTNWATDIHYHEDTKHGIGNLNVTFWIRDGRDEMKRIYEGLDGNDAKRLACHYIDFMCRPCDWYEDDMVVTYNGVGDDYGIEIGAEFRV